MFEFFRQNPRAAEALRGPLFEEKVSTSSSSWRKVEEKTVTPEELAKEPPAPAITDQPAATTDQSAAAIDQPAVTTDQPAATDQSAEATDRPAATE